MRQTGKTPGPEPLGAIAAQPQDGTAAGREREPLRERIRALAARVQASADATRPSAKTRAEDELAAALRQILEES